MVKRKTNESILELDAIKAHKFLLEPASYCNLDLPSYFSFRHLLEKIDKELDGSSISAYFVNKAIPNCFEGVNYTLLHNKDGHYAWRPLQLIHPALYVSLVQNITEAQSWDILKSRFKTFSNIENIKCESIPVRSLTARKDKAEQITHWWDRVEQRSIELSLEYEYLIHADVADCYSSIYSHSISWALHDKKVAKEKRNDKSLLGNIIDRHMGYMSNGQTNGIPQGSVIMDFVAEMVLGYVDLKLAELADKQKISGFYIIRYRDDYRIFVNSPRTGDDILKLLTTALFDVGLKLNPSKALISNDVINASIKADKLYWLAEKHINANIEKHLLILHGFSLRFPNSGTLVGALSEYHKRIMKIKRSNMLPALVAIITDIICRNPRAYAVCVAILSHIISLMNAEQKKIMVEKIRNRLKKVSHTGYLDIWIQRFAHQFDEDIQYDELLCHLVVGESVKIWNSDWLNPRCAIKKIVDTTNIVDFFEFQHLGDVIKPEEYSLFRVY